MQFKTILAAAGSLAALAVASPAWAGACEDLASFRLDGGTITSAEVVAAGGFAMPTGAGALPACSRIVCRSARLLPRAHDADPQQ